MTEVGEIRAYVTREGTPVEVKIDRDGKAVVTWRPEGKEPFTSYETVAWVDAEAKYGWFLPPS